MSPEFIRLGNVDKGDILISNECSFLLNFPAGVLVAFTSPEHFLPLESCTRAVKWLQIA